MKAAQIEEALINAITSWLEANSLGENDVLSSTQNTSLTDKLAEVLETVNPDHNYPPTNK